MSDAEEEWVTVRRRRGRTNTTAKQLQKLAIPVVPLGFDALREDDTPIDPSKSSKKKKKKKSKAAAEDDEDDEEEDGDLPSGQQQQQKATSTGGTIAKKAGPGPASAAATQASFLAWLWARLVAILVALGLMRASASKRRRKGKGSSASSAPAAALASTTSASPAAAAPAAAATTAAPKPAAAAAVATASKPAAPASQSTPKAAPAPQPAKPVAPKPSAPAPSPATPAPASAPKPPQPTPAKHQQPVQTPAAPPAPSAVVAAAASTPLPAAPAAASREPEKPRPPPAPTVKCDGDWARGKVLVSPLPGAHPDVVSAVALAGEVAVSAGYDGSIKLWHWPPVGRKGGSVAPRLTCVRNLVGHSGRVEALAAHGGLGRLVSSGRDSSLKVWDLGGEAGGAEAHELASTYVYESIRSMAADWGLPQQQAEAGGGAGSSGAGARLLLGARSGTVLLYSLGAGGQGRKAAALRGHGDEVTALSWLPGGSNRAASGSRDGTVRLWDVGSGKATAVLSGFSGRVCSLAVAGDHHLFAGDCSSTLKLWDLRMLPSSPSAAAPEPRRLPNGPSFAGDACPTAGLWSCSRASVLLSTSIAWWTENREALEEAPPSAKLPMALLNVSAFGQPTLSTSTSSASAGDAAPTDGTDWMASYKITLRLGPGVVTSMAVSHDESSMLLGGATGALWAVQLVRGGSGAVAAAERAVSEAAAAGVTTMLEDGLYVGVEEFSDDEYDDGEEDEEEDEE